MQNIIKRMIYLHFFLWFYILCVKYRDIIQFCSVIIY